MTITEIKTIWARDGTVYYNGAEYGIHSIAVYKDKLNNRFYNAIILHDLKANSIVQVRVEDVKENIREDKQYETKQD